MPYTTAKAVTSRRQVFCQLYMKILAVTFVLRAKVMSVFASPSQFRRYPRRTETENGKPSARETSLTERITEAIAVH